MHSVSLVKLEVRSPAENEMLRSCGREGEIGERGRFEVATGVNGEERANMGTVGFP